MQLTSIAAAFCLFIAGSVSADIYNYPQDGAGDTTDPRYTSVSMGSSPGLVPFLYSLDFQVPGFAHFGQVRVGDSSITSPIDMEFYGLNLNATGDRRYNKLRLGSFDMKQVNLTMTDLNLYFGGPASGDSNLSMTNSRLLLTPETRLKYEGGGRFTINALDGNNVIQQGAKSSITSPVTVNVSPGASLEFRDFLGPNPSDATKNLRFSNLDTTINVDGGMLSLHRAKLFVDKGVVNLTNGAEMRTSGSEWSGAVVSDLKIFRNSRLTLGSATEVIAGYLEMGSARINLAGTAVFNARNALVIESNEITGPSPTPQYIPPSHVTLTDLNILANASLKVTNVTDLKVDTLTVESGGALMLETGTSMRASNIALNGGRLDLSDRASLVILPMNGLSGEFTGSLYALGAGSAVNLAPKAGLLIAPRALLIVDERMTLTNRSLIEVGGRLTANGSVLGDGAVLIQSGGSLAPYLEIPRTGYASIHLDNSLGFQKDAQILLTLDPAGTLPTRPMITYGPLPVTYYGAPVVELRGSGSLNAKDLAGKSITVIAAQAPGVAGTIDTGGFTPTIKPVNMPALLGYTVGDTGTHGKPDLTLFMDSQLSADPQRNPALNTKNRQGTASLLIAAAANNPSAASAANTITNEQLNQLHAEPYPSFITVNLEAIANTRNAVFARATNVDPTGQRFWIDTSESRGSIDGQNGLGNFGYALSNLTLGKDFGQLLGGAWGGYFAYGRNRVTEADIATQQLGSETHSVGVYGQWQHSSWESRVLLGYRYGTHDSKRFLSLSDFSGVLQAQYSSHSLQAGLRLSHDWIDHNGFELRPEVGGSITTYRQLGFSEAGNTLHGLNVSAARAASRIAHIGLNAKWSRFVADVPVRPVAFTRLEHDFASSREHAVSAALQANPGYSQSFIGQGRGPSTMTLGLGFSSDGSGRFQMEGGLVIAQHTHGRERGAGIRLRYVW